MFHVVERGNLTRRIEMADVIIFGIGHTAQMMKVYIEKCTKDKVVGFVVDPEYYSSDRLEDLPVAVWDDLEDLFPPGSVAILGPVTYRNMNRLRVARHAEAIERGYELASFIHPNSIVHAKTIGRACIILEMCAIQPFVELGDGVVIWSSVTIGHHSVIEDYCFISSQAGVGGRSRIGKRCYLGGQVGIMPGVHIGESSVVLNAAAIGRNLPPESVVKGPGSNHVNGKVMRIKSSRLGRLL
jgi:UDP-3-O-[3-hydroxymyristoyl] glucosamine N-acyltransferase